MEQCDTWALCGSIPLDVLYILFLRDPAEGYTYWWRFCITDKNEVKDYLQMSLKFNQNSFA